MRAGRENAGGRKNARRSDRNPAGRLFQPTGPLQLQGHGLLHNQMPGLGRRFDRLHEAGLPQGDHGAGDQEGLVRGRQVQQCNREITVAALVTFPTKSMVTSASPAGAGSPIP